MKSLPLTPLESYLCEDDVPAHPCWQVSRIGWLGTFEREHLEKAWAESTARQPLLTARVYRGALGGLRWKLGAGRVPPIHWSVAKERRWPEWAPLDPFDGPGARLYVVEYQARTDVIICVHHAVCDGLSLLEILEDTFLAYARSRGDEVAFRPDPTPASVRRRGCFGSGALERLWIPLVQMAGMAVEAKLLRRTVAPLIPHTPPADEGPPPSPWPSCVIRSWDERGTSEIRAAAKHAGTSLHGLFMRDVPAAIGAWRTAQGIGSPEDWIRLGTSIGLRHPIKGSWPASNRFGIAIIDRQQRSLANRERLLRRAREDLALVDRWRLGFSMWTLLALRRFMPGGIRGYARKRVVRTTFTMSFMGFLFLKTALPKQGRAPSVPGAVMEDVHGFAPTRPGTCATLDIALLFGKVFAYLNYDPRVMSRGQAESLMEALAAELARSVKEARTP